MPEVLDFLPTGGPSVVKVPVAKAAPAKELPVGKGGPPLAPKEERRVEAGTPKPNPFAVTPALAAPPLHTAHERVAQQVVKAIARSSPQLPHVPLLPSYSLQQREAALHMLNPAIARAAPEGSAQGLSELYQASPHGDQLMLALAGRLNAERTAERARFGVPEAATKLTHAGVQAGAEEERLRQELVAAGAHPAQAAMGASLLYGKDLLRASVAKAEAEHAEQQKAGDGIPLIGTVVQKLATLAPLKAVPVVGKIADEALDLPAQTFLSAADTGTAVRQLAEGKPQAAVSILKQLGHTVTHPVQSLEQQPLSTALLFAGGEDALGQVAGKIARGVGGRVGELASTVRPDLEVPGAEGMNIVRRPYSGDVVRKGLQVMAEKAVRARDLAASDERDLAPEKATPRQVHKQLIGSKLTPGIIDGDMTGRDALQRQERAVAQKLVGNKLHEATGPIMERALTRPDRLAADLESERARLLQRVQLNKGADKNDARAQLAQIESLQGDKDFLANPGPVFEHAQRLIDEQHVLEPQKIAEGIITPSEAEAKYMPYAQSHMGAVANDQEFPVAGADEKYGRMKEVERSQRARLGEAERAYASALKDQGRLFGTHRSQRAQSDGLQPRRVAQRARDRQFASNWVKAAKVDRDAARADLKDAIAARKGAKPTKANRTSYTPRLTLNGRPLSTDEIKAHMEANGVSTPGFLSQKDGVAGKGSYHKAPGKRPALPQERLALAYEAGLHDRSAAAVRGQMVNDRLELAAHRSENELLRKTAIGTFGKNAARHFGSPDEAATAKKNLEFKEDGSETPLRKALGELEVVPLGPKQIVQHYIQNAITGAGHVMRKEGLEEHTRFDEGVLGDKNVRWTLQPKEALKRIDQHNKALAGEGLIKGMQVATGLYRKNALIFSPRWAAGVLQENLLKGPIIGGTGLRDLFAGRKFAGAVSDLAKVDGLAQHASRQLAAQIEKSGGVFQSAELQVHRDAESFVGTAGEGIAKGAARVAASPGVRHAIDAWRWYGQKVSNGMTKLEHSARTAALGKAVRQQMKGMTDSYGNALKATDDAYAEYAKGVALSSGKAKYLFDAQQRVLGNYVNLTPELRKMTQTWAPFGLWWLNSTRWLARMPLDHPLKTAVIAALYQGTTKLREEQNKGLPSYEKGTIAANLPVVGNIRLDPTYYSPPGLASGGPIGALESAAGLVLPQVMDFLNAAKGDGPFGEELHSTNAEGKEAPSTFGQRAGEIGKDALGDFVPLLRQAEQVVAPTGTKRSVPQELFKLGFPARYEYPPHSTEASSGGYDWSKDATPAAKEYDWKAGSAKFKEYDWSKH